MLYLTVVLKLLIGMLGVLIFLRLTGKTQMAHMTPIDAVNTIILGALVGSIIYMPDVSIWVLMFSIATWTLVNLLIRRLLRINFFSRLIHGQDELLIHDGKLDLRVLKRNNIGIDQLRAKLREHEIYSLMEVDEVRFETDGKFTIFKNTGHPESFLLVSNGEILKESLTEAGQTEQWVKEELRKAGFGDLKDIFCAEWTRGEGLYIITSEGNIKIVRQKSEKTHKVAPKA